MSNIPGISGYTQPGVFSRVRTIRRSVSIPGGLRILAIIGLGQAEETVILCAEGGGLDGVNNDYAGSSAPDGRHFVLKKTNLIPKRTTLTLDGMPLTGIEETIDLAAFDSRYDYRLEPLTGRIELQKAHLVDQGGQYYIKGTGIIGDGTITTLTLLDVNAPTETWTIKATSVIRDAYGDPVRDMTTFLAIGSVSGQPIDANGMPIVFVADGSVQNNGIIELAITEGPSRAFERGDRFTVKIESGVLRKGQVLEANYIAEEDLYDPEFFVDANSLFAKHGFVSETNTLSLGASMAFENGAFGLIALQAKPPIPRRTTEVLLARDEPLTVDTEGFPPVGTPVKEADEAAFNYPIMSGTPAANTNVNIFIIDRNTGEDKQIFPTKVGFYNSSIEADPYHTFITNPNYSYSYTIIESAQVEQEGNDGVVALSSAKFTASSGSFAEYNLDIGELGTNKQLRILSVDKFGGDTSSIAGLYNIVSVGDAYGDTHSVTLNHIFSSAHANLRWELVDATELSPRLLLTSDLYTSGAIRTKDGIKISLVDVDDADFFDTNWAQAFETLEGVDCQIVVPLPDATYSAIQQASVAHCELMSNTANQKERMTLIGAQKGVTSEALIGRELVAVEDIGVIEGIQGDDVEEVLAGNIEDLQNFDVQVNFGTTFRAIYFWPDEIIRNINGSNITLHGFYAAACAGGLLAATANYAMPLTRKVLVGFSILRSKLRRPIILNALGDRGVSVLVPVIGGGQILHCKTTTSGGDPLEEEPSVVFIRDRTAQSLRSVLRGFIGQPESITLTAEIATMVVKTLQGLVSQGLLSSYRGVSVARDAVEPRQWNVSCEVQPVLPVNWIFIDVSVGIL
jgi:hypothetical protein